MSPFNILKSPGSSSKDVLLSSLPNLLILSLSDKSSPSSSLSLVIVLNLYIVKISSYRPGLLCLNNIGLPSLNLTSITTTSNTGESTIIATKDNIISINLFKYFLYTPPFLFLTCPSTYSHNPLIISTTISKSSSVILVSDGRHRPFLNSFSPTSEPI